MELFFDNAILQCQMRSRRKAIEMGQNILMRIGVVGIHSPKVDYLCKS